MLAFDVVVPPGPLQHEVDRNLAIVEVLGARVENRRLEICLTENDRKFASELLNHHDRRRVLVAIGIGARAASRKWPLQRYAECIARLNQQRLVQPVIVCSGEEDARGLGALRDAGRAAVHSQWNSVAGGLRSAGAVRTVRGQ